MRLFLPLFWMAAMCQAQFYRTRIYNDSVVYQPRDIITAPDGSCLIVGGVIPDSTDSGEVFIMKVSRYGDRIWTKRYGGEGRDDAVGIEATEDGNFMIAGNTSTGTGGVRLIYLLKITTDGDTLWTGTAGTGCGNEILNMSKHSDGTFLLCGRAGRMDGGREDMFVCNVNGDGDTLWTRTFGDSARWDQAHLVATTSIGNILLCGTKADTGGYMIIEPSGSSFWETRWDDPLYILPLEGGQYLITRTYNDGFSGSLSVMNISTSLQNRVWHYYYRRDIYSITAGPLFKAADNAFYQFVYSMGVVLIKIGQNGREIWQKTFTQHDFGRIVASTRLADGNYMILGENGTRNISLVLLFNDQYAWKSMPFTFKIPVSGDSLSYTYTSLLVPAGMTVSSGGTISWVPQTDGTYMDYIEVLVSDGADVNDTITFDIIVNDSAVKAGVSNCHVRETGGIGSLGIHSKSSFTTVFDTPVANERITIFNLKGARIRTVVAVDGRAVWNISGSSENVVGTGMYIAAGRRKADHTVPFFIVK